jgi:hypothetical protein
VKRKKKKVNVPLTAGGTKMAKKNTLLTALVVSLIVLVQLTGGIGCLVKESGSGSPIATARETLYAQMTWLEGQKFEGPNPLTPIPINVDDVESETMRINSDERFGGTGVGVGISVGGGIGVGGGISIGGGGG